jgi:hypothetical protein
MTQTACQILFGIAILDFEFVSDFEIRISDFDFPASRPTPLSWGTGGGGVVGPVFRTRVVQPNILERLTIEGESPVGERPKRPIRHLSTT